MKKFYSLLMLVVLTIPLSACDKKQPKADFTFEVNNFVNANCDKDNDLEVQEIEITADINIINNTKYYVTNYPVVYWLVDANGDVIGEDGFFEVGSINLGPKDEVNYPFSLSKKCYSFSEQDKCNATLDILSSATDIKISALTYEMLKPIGDKKGEDLIDFNEFMGIEEDFTDGLINMSQETFDNTLSLHLSKEPKHIGGAPTLFYSPSSQPITPTIQTKVERHYDFEYNKVEISVEFTNDTDYLIDVGSMDGILDVKDGDKIIKRIYIKNITFEDGVAIMPKTIAILTVESQSNKDDKSDLANEINKYTYQFTFVPSIQIKGAL